MSLLAAAFLALASGSAEPTADMPTIDPRGPQPAACPATSRYEAGRRGKAPKAQKLTELPDADAYKAVYRRIGRCMAPIIVKYGVGNR
jgi:hypothetical protein